MADPYLGEIRIFAGNYAPQGWAFCQGQLLSIQQNSALFALLGTMYGGNGTTNFALPDLRGRFVISFGQGPGLQNYTQGQAAGTETVTLTTNQLPAHNHPLTGSDQTPSQPAAAGNYLPSNPGRGGAPLYANTRTSPQTMAPDSIGNTGNSQPVPNLSPYLTINYIIALQGIFPPRS